MRPHGPQTQRWPHGRNAWSRRARRQTQQGGPAKSSSSVSESIGLAGAGAATGGAGAASSPSEAAGAAGAGAATGGAGAGAGAGGAGVDPMAYSAAETGHWIPDEVADAIHGALGQPPLFKSPQASAPPTVLSAAADPSPSWLKDVDEEYHMHSPHPTTVQDAAAAREKTDGFNLRAAIAAGGVLSPAETEVRAALAEESATKADAFKFDDAARRARRTGKTDAQLASRRGEKQRQQVQAAAAAAAPPSSDKPHLHVEFI